MVETESGLKLKYLRSDNGGEYIDEGFKEYCAVNVIRMEKTVSGTLQQNDIVERMNRTINELFISIANEETGPVHPFNNVILLHFVSSI